MKRFPRGSEWRKWDLHVHPPYTKLSDGYKSSGVLDDIWTRFCSIIHQSEVQAIGIADYFSFDGFFSFLDIYHRLYPNSTKVFFPNLEIRLNEVVNGAAEVVDFHLLFRPDFTKKEANELLSSLKTQQTVGKEKTITCAALSTQRDFEQATISRIDINIALKAVFGEKAVLIDHVILLAPANNNGIRADLKSERKKSLSDEIDKLCNGVFGGPQNVKFFLRTDRYENPDQISIPKPVFAGCDAHSFEQLESGLGKEVTSEGNRKYVTWVKGDLSFEGLQQTLIEPSERVRIQELIPDNKEPYKVISRIEFDAPDIFPQEVVFNPGLNTIIGSRSSGKSALLAYISHAIDPQYTVMQQVAATKSRESEVGPGASITWDDVKNIKYKVEWASPSATHGKVIYIPQNSLYAISERPDEITAKIKPVLFRSIKGFESQLHDVERETELRNNTIRDLVISWFRLTDEIRSGKEEILGLGDKKAISERIDELKGNVVSLQSSSSFNVDELSLYQRIIGDISRNDGRITEIENELNILQLYIKPGHENGTYITNDRISVTIDMVPTPSTFPDSLQKEFKSLLADAKSPLLEHIKARVVEYYGALILEAEKTKENTRQLQEVNRELFEKQKANTQITALIDTLKVQEETLKKLGDKDKLIHEKSISQQILFDKIASEIKERDEVLIRFTETFNEVKRNINEMEFAIETDFESSEINRISNNYNRQENSPYITEMNEQRCVDAVKAIRESPAFIEYMASGKQKLRHGTKPVEATIDVLTTTKSMRFAAILEGDRIGGFHKSSMTAGKQALFALTLILAESDEPWPLLIDQPEDDLDSRSVCDVIVKDLMKRKKSRQIIMVSHDANLAIGADSEEIIVANRHGDDRPNRDGKMFAYLTGSLEHNEPKRAVEKCILESCGIREHACEILDGGTEAFRKRKAKYGL